MKPPILIQAGIKCTSDLFYFNIPMLLQVLFVRQNLDSLNTQVLQQIWGEVATRPEMNYTVPSMSNQITNVQVLINRLKDNNVYYMSKGKNQ